MAHQTARGPEAEMQGCIDECLACHRICLETARHCLEMGGELAEASHVGALLDCADICATSAAFMLRGSPLHGATCSACAAACERCADSCEELGPGDEQMEACADACRRCADSCQRMASASGAGAGTDVRP